MITNKAGGDTPFVVRLAIGGLGSPQHTDYQRYGIPTENVKVPLSLGSLPIDLVPNLYRLKRTSKTGLRFGKRSLKFSSLVLLPSVYPMINIIITIILFAIGCLILDIGLLHRPPLASAGSTSIVYLPFWSKPDHKTMYLQLNSMVWLVNLYVSDQKNFGLEPVLTIRINVIILASIRPTTWHRPPLRIGTLDKSLNLRSGMCGLYVILHPIIIIISAQIRPLLAISLRQGSPNKPILRHSHPSRPRDHNQVIAPSCLLKL